MEGGKPEEKVFGFPLLHKKEKHIQHTRTQKRKKIIELEKSKKFLFLLSLISIISSPSSYTILLLMLFVLLNCFLSLWDNTKILFSCLFD